MPLEAPPKDLEQDSPSIKIVDVLRKKGIETRRVGRQLVCGHPVHGSTNNGNFVVDPDKNVWHCFRCESGGGALSLIAVLEGIISCGEAVTGGLRGDKFKEAVRIAKERYGFDVGLKSIEGAAKYVPDLINENMTKSVKKRLRDFSQAEVAYEILEENALLFVSGDFYTYENGVWRKDRTRFVEREIKKRLEARATRNLIESIKYLVSLECQIYERELNKDPMLINFRNGVFDLRFRNLLPHSEDYHSTIQLPFDFQPDASCPRWRQFVDEVFCGDGSLAMLLQEVLGYVLIPDTSMQKMFWFIGEGANGKGVTLKVLESLIDDNNRTSLDVRNLHNPFVRAAMHNKLLSVQGDFPKKFFGNEDLVKTIVGGDTLDAQEKFKPQFEFTPFCRFIFAMNSLPDTKDKSHGFFRRVVIIPFNRVFSEKEQDRTLIDKLRAELSGIFLWVLEGLQRLVQNKSFTESTASMQALDYFKREHNSVGLFVETACLLAENAKCTVGDLWTHYENFCAEGGIEPLLRKEFARLLRTNFPLTVKTHRWASGEAPKRTYFGIGLLND